IEPAADLLEHLLTARGATTRRFHGSQEGMQLVEVQLTDVVERLPADRERQAGGSDTRAVAVWARVLDHDLVEPRLHVRVRCASLAVPPVVPFDAARDAVEADGLP